MRKFPLQIECHFRPLPSRRERATDFVQHIDGTIVRGMKAWLFRRCVVGTFSLHIIQLNQLVTSPVIASPLRGGPFGTELADLASLVDRETLFFRSDLPIQPCNILVAIDRFEITHHSYNKYSPIKDCIEEIIRLFAYNEVIAIKKGAGIDPQILKQRGFAAVTESPYFVRDNELYRQGEFPVRSTI